MWNGDLRRLGLAEASALPERFAESEFRVGSVLNRAWSLLAGNFLPFFLVTAIASLPDLWFANPSQSQGLIVIGGFLSEVTGRLSEALVVFGAFQQMRGKPVRLVESLQVGSRRIVPVIALAISASVLTTLGFVLLIIPGLIVVTMWFVAAPVCVVEKMGPFNSMERSAQLTNGHRWKIFALLLLMALPVIVVEAVIELMVELEVVGGILAAVIHLIWDAIWEAGYAALIIATYHDLRVVKEGVDTDQIAAVFE
jgi:hypothetical protein